MMHTDRKPTRPYLTVISTSAAALLLAACADAPQGLSVETGGTQESGEKVTTEAPPVDTGIQPMYRELMAIDLQSVVRVAAAQNLDIQQARERVVAARGRYESSVESAVPTLSPGITLGHLSGTNQTVTGQLVPANFTTLNPALLVQLLLNPGQVIYDAIAAKKRLLGTEQQEQFAVIETLRQAARQYYELVLARTRVSVAREALSEAKELSRVTDLRLKAGTAIPADAVRARASLAGREQDLTGAINGFYQASIALALILHLDSTITLVPKSERPVQSNLVEDDLSIDQMLEIAVQRRPDLRSMRSFAAASGADAKSALWGGVGPQFQGSYQFGVIRSQTPDQSFDMEEQRRAYASAGLNLSPVILGRVKTANAVERQALVDAERKLDIVRADVVSSLQESATQAKLIPAAQQQLDASSQSLRLAQANFRVGMALLLDVLQSEDAVNDARLRYTSAVVSYNKAQVNLVAALGLLDSKSMTTSVAMPPSSATSNVAPPPN